MKNVLLLVCVLFLGSCSLIEPPVKTVAPVEVPVVWPYNPIEDSRFSGIFYGSDNLGCERIEFNGSHKIRYTRYWIWPDTSYSETAERYITLYPNSIITVEYLPGWGWNNYEFLFEKKPYTWDSIGSKLTINGKTFTK